MTDLNIEQLMDQRRRVEETTMALSVQRVSLAAQVLAGMLSNPNVDPKTISPADCAAAAQKAVSMVDLQFMQVGLMNPPEPRPKGG